MKPAFYVAVALGLILTAGCSERDPASPVEPVMTDAKFAELRESAIEIANRINAAGKITATDRAEIEALRVELGPCATAEDAARSLNESAGESGPPITAAAPIDPSPDECTSCPFIIVKGNCVGVLRSSGPCRPGAGLERCFYNWYCYSYRA